MKIPQPQPTPPQAVAVAGPEGKPDDPSFVEVLLTSQHEVASGEVQILEPSTARIPLEKQQERAWFDDKLPTAVTPGGNWGFSTLAGRKAHTEPASVGTYGHWFQGDQVGLAINRGDVLFAHVYIPADSVPASIMLEWHDGDGWEHRAYWGADKIRQGKPNTASRFHVARCRARPAGGSASRCPRPRSASTANCCAASASRCTAGRRSGAGPAPSRSRSRLSTSSAPTRWRRRATTGGRADSRSWARGFSAPS